MTARLRCLWFLAALATCGPAWAQSDTDTNYFLTGNYYAVLGRMPDSAGWIYNKQALVGGLTWTNLTNNFLGSPEYALEPLPDNYAFITDLYEDAWKNMPAAP